MFIQRVKNPVQINFKGGIISPGELMTVAQAAENCGVKFLRFGLRQQLIVDISDYPLTNFLIELGKEGIEYSLSDETKPNIVSSYPAEEIFIQNTWLSEGVYRDILDGIDYSPKLKINISDSNQSFTPLLTGNLNWVAHKTSQHFWHLLIRFPQTNSIYEWSHLLYTNDIAKLSGELENIIYNQSDLFIANEAADGDILFSLIDMKKYITQVSNQNCTLPIFNLPYYEGINRYRDKYWLGIYRRDEYFSIPFLKELCQLCFDTKLGQICSTPWKSIIIKSIEDSDRLRWNQLLSKHQINIRHAANELNFQVEENCKTALKLKQFLVRHFFEDDIRTFGLCIGIKTQSKTEIFSSILIRKKPLFTLGPWKSWPVYDILCAKDFNPNERTGIYFAQNIPKYYLPEYINLAIASFNSNKNNYKVVLPLKRVAPILPAEETKLEYLYQCKHCLSVYDQDADQNQMYTEPKKPPASYQCELCAASAKDFILVDSMTLGIRIP